MKIIPFIMLAMGLGSAIWTWITRKQKTAQASTPQITPDLAAYQSTGILPPDAHTHTDWRIRLEAVKHTPAAPESIPSLIRALHDQDSDVREAAVEILSRVGAPAVDALIDLMDHRSQEVRTAVVHVLSQIDNGTTTNLLIDMLEDESSWVREPAAAALGQRKAANAVPALILCLQDTSPQVKTTVINALKSIGTPEALAALTDNA